MTRRDPLHIRIESRVRALRASLGGDESFLGEILTREMIERIASEAAKEAQDYYYERDLRTSRKS